MSSSPTVDRLEQPGADYAQGYHLERPSPVDEALGYLAAPGSVG